MLNQNGGSRTDTLIKLVLVFFLSLLSFSVGTFVGKQFSDSQHKIADLETEGDRNTASIPPDTTKVEPNKAISEDEISKLSDEFIKKEQQNQGAPAKETGTAKNEEGSNGMTGAMVGEEKQEMKKADAKKKVSVHDEIANVAKRIASGEKIEAPKKVLSRIPSSLPAELADSSIGKFTVQVSSQASEDEAKAKAQELKDKGFSAFYVPATVDGKKWYRVSVGLFDTAGAAKKYRSKLMHDAHLGSAIVQKIVK